MFGDFAGFQVSFRAFQRLPIVSMTGENFRGVSWGSDGFQNNFEDLNRLLGELRDV